MLRPKFFCNDFAKVHDGPLAISSIFHNHSSSIWIPDPAFFFYTFFFCLFFLTTDRVLLQTKIFCSGHNTAYLTFSTASLLRKLCNCYTGFFFKKKESPKIRSNDLSPNRIWDSKQKTGRGRSSLYPLPLPLCDYAISCIYKYGGCNNRDVFV